MRREDREITDPAQLERIIADSSICHVAFAHENQAYVVPLNFGYVFSEEQGLTLYFHGAQEGRKIEMMRANPRVSFVMDCRRQIITGDAACKWSYAYCSIMGEGLLEEVTDPQECLEGMRLLMHHYGGGVMNDFVPETMAHTLVLRLTVERYTGKKNAKV